MSLLIKNGEIVTATERYIADIWCEGETISLIAPNIDEPPDGSVAEVIDATGKFVFPGFIDPHTHIYLPFMGTLAKDTYTTGSQAALIGGTTTIFDMCCPSRQQSAAEGFAIWKEQAAGKSACDYSFHMGVTRFDENTRAELEAIVAEGIASFKIFLAYKGAFGIEDSELYQTLKLAAELGVIVCAHCENETLVAERQKELLGAGLTGPEQHYESRPPIVEAEGVHHLMTFAELLGTEIYIVHLSCIEALRQAVEARLRGVNVTVETLIQYLLLSNEDTQRPDFEGAKYVMSPPLRDVSNQEVLWNALRSGLIQTVATDHAPFDFASQKPMGAEDFTKIPNGIPALEDRINLLHTYGVEAGRIDLHTMVAVASTNVAKTFGLFPRKGAIQPGSDADLVIFDPNWRGTISAATQTMNVDYSAFEGWELKGRPSVVAVRGEVAVRDGKFVGTVGRGQLLARPVR